MIQRNGKVYISHTPQDQTKYALLVEKLSEKTINCWSTISPEDSDSYLSQQTKNEIAGRDVFLRICTPAAAASARMQMEAWAFGATQAEDNQTGTPNQHIRIDLVMDTEYISDPAHPAYLTIDAINRPMNDWLVVLYKEMGKMQATRAMGRRTTRVVVIASVVVALILLFACVAFFALFSGSAFFVPGLGH
jgi:TIR domain